MSFATINGLTIHYRVDGPADGLPIVFANSLGSDHRIWDGVVANLAGDFCCIRYDKRGHGLSDCPPAPYSIQDHTDDLGGLLNQLDIERPVVAGISIGGKIALNFAANNPDTTRAIIACDTTPGSGQSGRWQERIDAVNLQGMATLANTALERWFAPSFREREPAAWHGYRNMVARVPPEGYIGSCAALRDCDLSGVIGQIEAPALVLTGSFDQSAPPEQAQAMANAMPERFVRRDSGRRTPVLHRAAGYCRIEDS
ncbi:MAG: alpha/beta fold hydrolase [Thermomicrobiales bacterium]